MKRILSILTSLLLLLMISVSAFAEDETIKTEEDAITAARQELEVWKEMGLINPEIAFEGEPDDVVEIEPNTGDDYWYGRVFPHSYEVRWWMGQKIGTMLDVPAYGCNLRIDCSTGKIVNANIEAMATEDDEPDMGRTIELEMETADPDDPTKTITETKTIYFYKNFDDIFSSDMTVDEFCELLADYWGFSGYTIADTVDEVEYHSHWDAIDGSTLLKDLNRDTNVNYYLTVFFDGDQDGAPIYVSLHQYPGYVMMSVGIAHVVG